MWISRALTCELPLMTLHNGLGGFTDDGLSYAIVLEGAEETPMPWVNVIANPRFGTIVTASGASHTWSANSRENRLTPFANDPVSDPTAEALFVRDDETGETWSPTPGPIVRGAGQRPLRRAPYRRADAILPGRRRACGTSSMCSSTPRTRSSSRSSR